MSPLLPSLLRDAQVVIFCWPMPAANQHPLCASSTPLVSFVSHWSACCPALPAHLFGAGNGRLSVPSYSCSYGSKVWVASVGSPSSFWYPCTGMYSTSKSKPLDSCLFTTVPFTCCLLHIVFEFGSMNPRILSSRPSSCQGKSVPCSTFALFGQVSNVSRATSSPGRLSLYEKENEWPSRLRPNMLEET